MLTTKLLEGTALQELIEPCSYSITKPMATILMRRRWRRIGHVTHQEDSIAKTALHWTPGWNLKSSRPKNTLRRTVKREIKEMGKDIKLLAKDRQFWKKHVAALHVT